MTLINLLSYQLSATQTTSRSGGKILDSALHLVSQQGTQVNMDEIASQAGVSRTTIFRHFGSKDELMESLIKREISALLSICIEEATKYDDPMERAVEVITLLFYSCITHPLAEQFRNSERNTELLAAGIAGPHSLLDFTRIIITDLLSAVKSDSTVLAARPSDSVRADAIIHMLVGYWLLRDSNIDILKREHIKPIIADLI